MIRKIAYGLLSATITTSAVIAPVMLSAESAIAAPCNTTIAAGGGNVRFGRGVTLSACNGNRLVFQADGNLVVYTPQGQALWATGTQGTNADTLAIQADGNVVLYGANKPLWATNTSRNPNAFLSVQEDANVVVYAPTGQAIFQTGTNGGRVRIFNASFVWLVSTGAIQVPRF
jgi:hypothetical protein